MHVYTTLDIYLLIIIIYALGIPRMCREVEKTNINEKKIIFALWPQLILDVRKSNILFEDTLLINTHFVLYMHNYM